MDDPNYEEEKKKKGWILTLYVISTQISEEGLYEMPLDPQC